MSLTPAVFALLCYMTGSFLFFLGSLVLLIKEYLK